MGKDEFDPYNELGLSVTASTADIKRAYKKRSKEAHPDMGGSGEEFDRVSKAYRLLTDQRLRDRFDKTGSVEDEVENTTANAINTLGARFAAVCGHPKVDILDVVELVEQSLRKDIEERRDANRKHEVNIKRIQKVMKRIKHKKGAKMHDFVKATYEDMIRDAKKKIMHAEDEVTSFKRALELLKDYECEPGEEEFDPWSKKLGSFTSMPLR